MQVKSSLHMPRHLCILNWHILTNFISFRLGPIWREILGKVNVATPCRSPRCEAVKGAQDQWCERLISTSTFTRKSVELKEHTKQWRWPQRHDRICWPWKSTTHSTRWSNLKIKAASVHSLTFKAVHNYRRTWTGASLYPSCVVNTLAGISPQLRHT